MKLIPTILCGGAGSRLWPVSRELHPKPFIRLADGQSLLQKAWLRGAVLPDVAETLTVTNRELFFKTEDEYREVAAIPTNQDLANRFILEPFGRNTAPAIAAAHGEDANPAKHSSAAKLTRWLQRRLFCWYTTSVQKMNKLNRLYFHPTRACRSWYGRAVAWENGSIQQDGWSAAIPILRAKVVVQPQNRIPSSSPLCEHPRSGCSHKGRPGGVSLSTLAA